MNRAVVITGASSGIGKASALYLAGRGYRVFAGVRSPESAQELRAAGVPLLAPVTIDVTDGDSVLRAAETVGARVGPSGLYALVNNAGVGLGGPIEYLPLERFREPFEVNVLGVIRMIQAFLPLLRLAPGARIVNVGSVQGRAVTPFLAPYTCSKFALEGLTGTLRQELAPWGIHVTMVEPGIVRTEIFAKAAAYLSGLRAALSPEALDRYAHAVTPFEGALKRAASLGMDPGRVAATIGNCLAAPRPRARYVVGMQARILCALAALLPDRAWDWLMARVGIVKNHHEEERPPDLPR